MVSLKYHFHQPYSFFVFCFYSSYNGVKVVFNFVAFQSCSCTFSVLTIPTTFMCVLADISAHHLQLKCMDGNCFPGHPNIDSTAALSDKISPTFFP